MALNIEFVKRRWPLILGGLVGIYLLYYIVKHAGGGAASTPQDISGGANQVQALSAQADLTNAQSNAQTTIAAYSASVQQLAIAADLKANLAKTAAQLQATDNQTFAGEAVGLAAQQAQVSIQQIKTAGDVAQTQIQANTLVNLQAGANSVKMAQLNLVNQQIFAMFKGSKHFGSDITAFAPVIALETGSGGAAASLGQSNAQVKTASSGVAATAISAGSSVLKALFA